jgi:hypothetical protein
MLVLLCLTVSGAWADGSWTSGDCTVTLSDAGVLTVSGTGAMADYVSEDSQPWKDLRSSITSIVMRQQGLPDVQRRPRPRVLPLRRGNRHRERYAK